MSIGAHRRRSSARGELHEQRPVITADTSAELVVDDTGKPKVLPWEDWKPGDDQNTSGWVRATAPSGRADLEGTPLWSGELGYGVRPAQAGQSDPTAADYPADFDIALREVEGAEMKGVGVSSTRPTRSGDWAPGRS